MPPEQNELDSPLPLAGERWVSRRKARVVTAVLAGEITAAEACSRYQLSDGEFQSWVAAYQNYGVPGLRATRFQIYRDLKNTRRRGSSRASLPAATQRF